MRGYFVLGGGLGVIDLPTFSKHYEGNLVGARDKGHWVLDTEEHPLALSIPARDKQVSLWASSNAPTFRNEMEFLDSRPGTSYQEKLLGLDLPTPFLGVVVNENTSTHGSLGIKVCGVPLYVFGLTDTQLKTSYIVWSTEDDVKSILNAMPLRFLLYRFPVLADCALFIQGEAVCSKWWRWLKTHQQTLHGFNALEMKLYGQIKTR